MPIALPLSIRCAQWVGGYSHRYEPYRPLPPKYLSISKTPPTLRGLGRSDPHTTRKCAKKRRRTLDGLRPSYYFSEQAEPPPLGVDISKTPPHIVGYALRVF